MAGRSKIDIPYVSCIKVNGVHLLPPIITPERRKELQRLKHQATLVEQHIRNRKALKNNLDELLNYQPLSERCTSEASSKNHSHIDALGLGESSVRDDSVTSNRAKIIRIPNLSQDIIDVTQYDNDGIKLIRNDSSRSKVEVSHTDFLLNVNETIESPSSMRFSPKPRLIRSNSYTLDAPSPILLAHMEKQSDKDSSDNVELLKRLSVSKNWSSFDNNYTPFDRIDFKSDDTNCTFPRNRPSSSTPIHKASSKSDCIDIKEIKRSDSPVIEVTQTDVTVQQITVNTLINDKDSNDVAQDNKSGTRDSNSGTDQTRTSNGPQNTLLSRHIDDNLLQILQKIPEQYSKQIINIIEKQKLQDHKKPDDYEIFFDKFSNKSSPPNSATKIDSEYPAQKSHERNWTFSQCDKPNNSVISMSSQSLQYTISNSSSDTSSGPNVPSLKVIDLESETTDNIFDDGKTTEKSPVDFARQNSEDATRNLRNLNLSRELFPELEIIRKKEWAASIIGAYVKGYLVRRLLKTERVQTLIDTIHETLMFALQLHNSENIEEADVELHRRLIQQVSAACYTFHDVFFALSVSEQMTIISADRVRKIEKANRPASAPSARKSARHTRIQPIEHSKSLTKV